MCLMTSQPIPPCSLSRLRTANRRQDDCPGVVDRQQSTGGAVGRFQDDSLAGRTDQDIAAGYVKFRFRSCGPDSNGRVGCCPVSSVYASQYEGVACSSLCVGSDRRGIYQVLGSDVSAVAKQSDAIARYVSHTGAVPQKRIMSASRT